MGWFDSCKTLAEGRDIYRKMLMEHHPDKWPPDEKERETEIYKQIQIDFEMFLKQRPPQDFVKDFHQTAGASARASMKFADGYWEVLAVVMGMNVDVETIGAWINVKQYNGRDNIRLMAMGFWYSIKHDAMIWSDGNDKPLGLKPRYDTEELRARFGSSEKRKKRFV